MNRAALAGFSAVVLLLGSCAVADRFFGVTPEGEDATGQPGDSPAEAVGGFLGLIPQIGGAAAGVLGLVGAFYASMRRKRAGQDFRAVVEGIEGFVTQIRAAKAGDANYEQMIQSLYAAVSGASRFYRHREEFARLVAEIKAQLRGKAP